MDRQRALTQTTVPAELSSSTDTQLAGYGLAIARGAWVTSTILALGIFITLLPSYFALLQTTCTSGACAIVQPTPNTVQAIQKLGLSVTSYAVITLALTIVTTLACFTVSAVIFWRKSDDWMALLVAFAEVAFGILYVTDVLQESHLAWRLLAIISNVIGNGVVFLVGTLFPNGRFVPRWSRWLVIGWILWGMAFAVLHNLSFLYLLHTLVWLGVSACLAAGQIYRYRNVSHFIERQQTKWAVFGGAITALVLAALAVPRLIFPLVGQPGAFYALATSPLYPFGTFIVSLSIGMAIFRYRLYDIDLIINRTLVYGLLTSTLVLVYAGLIIALQFLLRSVISQTNDIAIVVSTLSIAALVQPLRQRIQHVIDRRFYRQKYNAVRIVAAFSATLREEIDLEQFREHLLEVIAETMQPAHASLWLPRSEPGKKRQLSAGAIAPRTPQQEE